jgi:hypothetical protein
MRWLLNVGGVAVLLAGFSGAMAIWRAADRAERALSDSMPLAPLDSRKDTQKMEIYYGKAGVMMESWTEWFQTMTHGKPLAETMVVASSAAAIVCFIAAGRQRPDPNV